MKQHSPRAIRSPCTLVALAAVLALTSSAFAQELPPVAAAPSVSAEAQADAELVIKVFTSMAKVIDANEGDCTKLANALDSWAKENKAEIELMQVALGRLVNLPPEVDELMEQSYGPRMQAVEPAMEKLVDCATEPKITEVLQLLMPAVD